MRTETPRSIARERAVEIMRLIAESVRSDSRVSIPEACAVVGISPKSFYRWLKTPPEKIDVTQVGALADWLHDEYGHADFAALWVKVSSYIG